MTHCCVAKSLDVYYEIFVYLHNNINTTIIINNTYNDDNNKNTNNDDTNINSNSSLVLQDRRYWVKWVAIQKKVGNDLYEYSVIKTPKIIVIRAFYFSCIHYMSLLHYCILSISNFRFPSLLHCKLWPLQRVIFKIMTCSFFVKYRYI